LLKGFAVRLLVRLGTEDYVAPRHTARVKPPVIRLRNLQAQPVVVCVGLSGQNHPTTLEFVLVDTDLFALDAMVFFWHDVV
jgi:hypothetical protein